MILSFQQCLHKTWEHESEAIYFLCFTFILGVCIIRTIFAMTTSLLLRTIVNTYKYTKINIEMLRTINIKIIKNYRECDSKVE
jgi:hypothetical protein